MCKFVTCFYFYIQTIIRNYNINLVLQNRLDRKVRLSGYGVELQMKSTEYKAQDDSMMNDKKTEIFSQEEEDAEVDGFIFKVLK